MSLIKIKAALETALNGISPSLSTAWENAEFTPVNGTPYQKANLLPAEPFNAEFSDNYRAQGILQVTLMYPLLAGSVTAMTRAELIKTTFKRGNTFTYLTLDVSIQNTPSIGNGRIDGDRWMLPVDIRYFAHVTA